MVTELTSFTRILHSKLPHHKGKNIRTFLNLLGFGRTDAMSSFIIHPQ